MMEWLSLTKLSHGPPTNSSIVGYYKNRITKISYLQGHKIYTILGLNHPPYSSSRT